MPLPELRALTKVNTLVAIADGHAVAAGRDNRDHESAISRHNEAQAGPPVSARSNWPRGCPSLETINPKRHNRRQI